jgi:M6 family metalloprotease-like protein
VSSAIPVSKAAPVGLEKHLVESVDVRSAKFERQMSRALPMDAVDSGSGRVEVFGPNKGLLNGRQTNTGAVRGLTILVNFKDVQAAISADDVHGLLNGEGYRGYDNFCSVREYFRLMSSGLLEYSNVVVGPITLTQDRRHYVDNPLFTEALEQVTAMGIDLAQFDSRNEGILDAVSFFYAGETLYENWLWPHNHFLEWRHGDYQTNFYQISSLGLHPDELKIGTFCHESGHMLCRFPDLYDYGRRDEDNEKSAGLGVYCLMSGGNHTGHGKRPAPICAYLRYLTQWVREEVSLNAPGRYSAAHGDYGRFLVYRTAQPNEYFLVENRSQLGLDALLPSGGLAVYHCDILGSNEWQGNTATRHYQCGLLQADARSSLERNENSGDDGDLYRSVSGEAIGPATVPNTLRWDGTDSGLRIHDIGAAGETLEFSVLQPEAKG